MVAADDGDGDATEYLSHAKSFVLTVRSVSEAPVIAAPKQVVAVAGQPLSVSVGVSDLDQDALTWSAQGLPTGAQLVLDPQYGQARLVWTPGAAAVGVYDVLIAVHDSGLPPADAGYTIPENPVPNVVGHNLRIVVRTANQAPELLGLQLDGQTVVVTDGQTTIPVAATEGVPLELKVFGLDPDADRLHWTVAGLEPGATIAPSEDGRSVALAWIPSRFAAQNSNTGTPGLWRVQVTASDGVAQFTRTLELTVANVNQTPSILPLPRQLAFENETLAFTVQTVDGDNDPVQLNLVYSEDQPQGVFFDAKTGYFEWTPNQDTVNNAQGGEKAFTFTFRATDGQAVTERTVQVRVFDVNRLPTLDTSHYAVLVGDSLSVPVIKGNQDSQAQRGIRVADADGAAQTSGLTVSFTNLPEGASYDAATGRLNWTPGPGQVGDTSVTVTVFDGLNSVSEVMVLRVVAQAESNAPQIAVTTLPTAPALPGQEVVVTVRADAWSAIERIDTAIRESGSEVWTPVALDTAGRLRITPEVPGLIELRVLARDVDGFESTRTHTIKVKDPADQSAPLMAWSGVFAGTSASTEPVMLSEAQAVRFALQEQQLMGWTIELVAAGSDRWQTLASEELEATGFTGEKTLLSLDPALWPNGVYQLRATAWDLRGKTTEFYSSLLVDSAQKTFEVVAQADASATLGGHSLALVRQWSDTLLPTQASNANWNLSLFASSLSSDQPTRLPSGATAPWVDGARVWVSVPADLADPAAPMVNLSFDLSVVEHRLGTQTFAPVVWSADFGGDQGWTLQAFSDEALAPNGMAVQEVLLHQGERLYSQRTGMPWVPTHFVLTRADGTQLVLGPQGQIEQVRHADGARWLVSDAGVQVVGSEAAVSLSRDDQGRVSLMTVRDDAGTTRAWAYLYGSDGSLQLVRALGTHAADRGDSLGTPVLYGAAGRPLQESVDAHLGALAGWSQGGLWSGELQATDATVLSFVVRESEIASTIQTPGQAGALIVAVTAELPAGAALQVGGGQVIATASVNGKTTHLVRITASGIKTLRLSGQGAAQVQLSVAGDLNRDGRVDGADASQWQLAQTSGNPIAEAFADLNGDGVVNATDRHILFANSGFAANQAPVAAAALPTVKTHVDLSAQQALASVAQDLEGDALFWRVGSATHGQAWIHADGKTLSFKPEAGYAGAATITVQADDGYAMGAPIELTVNVSDAKLLRLSITNLSVLTQLVMGQNLAIRVTGDFEDQQGVDLSQDGRYLSLSQLDLSDWGYSGAPTLGLDDARDRVTAEREGAAFIRLQRTDIDGRVLSVGASVNVRAVELHDDTDEDAGYHQDSFSVLPDVYPGTLSLTPGLTRQLKVQVTDEGSGHTYEAQAPSQPVFAGSAEVIEPKSGS